MKTCPTCGTDWSDETNFCPNDGTTLRAAEPTGDLIGSVIADRYHIEKKLGEGGMGAVYLGAHVKMGRKSAIKVMAQSMASDAEAIARFNREAANAARIAHPHVCAIYDFGETPDGVIYLAMEYIEGETLNQVLGLEGVLPPSRAVDVLTQTADALQAAHDLGIVHRDLKPDNIMLARGRSGEDVVKVVDFGIAKAMRVEEGQTVTKTGLVVGTPEYMSPEQLSGDVLDGRSDIYSLALVFYRMLTGTLPFEAITAQEMMIKRLTDEPKSLNAALPGADFPAELQRIMDHALARMPTERYDSAMAFATDAARAVQGMSLEAATSITNATTQLMQSAAGEEPPTTRISAASGGRARPSLTPDTPAPRPAALRTAKRPKWPIVVGAVVVLGAGGGTAYILMEGDSTPVRVAGGESTSTVTEDPVVVDSGDVGGGVPEAGPPTVRDTTRPPPVQQPPAETTAVAEGPGLDSAEHLGVDPAELGQRLRALEDALVIDESTDPRLRDSLLLLYNREDLPSRDRAKAASLIAYWYSAVGQGDVATLCPWFHRADSLDPGRYQAQLRDFCQQD